MAHLGPHPANGLLEVAVAVQMQHLAQVAGQVAELEVHGD